MALYPLGIDGYTTLPLLVDLVSPVRAGPINNLRNALVAVETELGINPSGTFATVRDRLDNLETGDGDAGAGFLTTKGDLLTRDSSSNTRIGVGTDGYVLTADSSQTTGLKWAAGGSSSGTGDVVGPAFSLDNSIARFEGTTGKLIQDSFIFITDTGRLGIGVAAPGALLDVRGSAIFNEAGIDVDFRIEGVGQANAFFVQGSDGNVGIGTGTPGVSLDISRNQNGNTAIAINNATSGNIAQASMYLVVNAGAGQYASSAVTSAGWTTVDLSLPLQYQCTTADGLTNGILFTTQSANAPIVFSATAVNNNGFLANAERLRINSTSVIVNDNSQDIDFRIEGVGAANAFFVQGSDGNVGIGTGTPSSRLDILDTHDGNTAIAVTNASAGSSAISSIFLVNNGGASGFTSWQYLGAGFATSGLQTANQAKFVADTGAVGGWLFNTLSAAAPIVFAIGGIALTNERLRINSTEVVVNDNGNATDFRVEGDTDQNAFFVKGSTDRIGIGTATPVAKLDITAGTLASGIYAHWVSATQSSAAAQQIGTVTLITTAGSGAERHIGGYFELDPGYTGAGMSAATWTFNQVAGIGTTPLGFDISSPPSNIGAYASAAAVTIGHNVGGYFMARRSTARNFAVIGIAQSDGGSPQDIGVYGTSDTLTGTPTNIGGMFTLYGKTDSIGTLTNAALIADNGATISPIFLGRDSGTTVFTIADGGALTQEGGAVFNEAGASVDFRVEGSGSSNALLVKGSNGNVGVGVSPLGLLHVQKNTNGAADIIIQNTDSGGSAQSRMDVGPNATGAGSRYLSVIYNNTTDEAVWSAADAVVGGLLIRTSNNNSIKFQTDTSPSTFTTRMTIAGSGSVAIDGTTFNVDAANDRVGIGTAAPTDQLHIKKAGASVVLNVESPSTGNLAEVLAYNSADDILMAIEACGLGTGASLNPGSVRIRGEGAGVTAMRFQIANTSSAPMIFEKDTLGTFVEFFRINTSAASGTESVFNDGGLARNFRVEGDTDANLLAVDGVNDRVGIGIAPTTKLQVDGYIFSSTSGFKFPDGTIQITAATGNVVGPGSATDNAIARFDLSTGKLIQNSSAFITDDGYVGFGSTAPQNKMVVALDGYAGQPTISLGTVADPDTGWFHPASNTQAWSTGGIEAMRLDSSQRLGVGTIAPANRIDGYSVNTDSISLTVAGDPNQAFIYAQHQDSGAFAQIYANGSSVGGTFCGATQDGQAVLKFGSASNSVIATTTGNLILGVSSTAVINIDGASGQVGIGKVPTAHELEVLGAIEASSDVIVTNNTKGLVLKDTAGTPHYWRVTVSTIGVLTTTDLGTSEP